ncbi:hypothetical protein [Altericista sp. CCNU0014]|uniref:hypothetical protein n=1 Tax=Altericista sp. CCNU0014 TaxID=3082949 RepID=UPI00384EF04E
MYNPSNLELAESLGLVETLPIGAVLNTQWLQGCLILDEKGFICTGIGLIDSESWPLQ